ncbi:MAG TPA: hypothetical protein VM286_03260 [Candidatus Thermoplasmatota archaeon]|nr:hypothetical protein [Candidatus Thermoplasmatota archaeon]
MVAPLGRDARRLDLQARFNQMSVRREELERRYPGSFGIGGMPPNPLGKRAPDGLVEEWRILCDALAKVEADLATLVPEPPKA